MRAKEKDVIAELERVRIEEERYPLLKTLRKFGRRETRANYLALYGWDNPTPKLTAEEELDLPPQMRRK